MPGHDRCAQDTAGDFDAQLAAARAELGQLRAVATRSPTPHAADPHTVRQRHRSAMR
jgi:hypothetical protein